jgi:hypothetical protein
MNKKDEQNGTCIEPVYMALNGEIDFEKALSQAINEGLASISTIVAPVLRAYLDDAVFYEIGRMSMRSTMKDVRKLERGLEKMFGFGAKVFEKKILNSLYTRLSLKSENSQNLSFSQEVKKAKEAFDLRKHKSKKKTRGHRRIASVSSEKRNPFSNKLS